MPAHNYFSILICLIADLLHGPYRPLQYQHVVTVLRRFESTTAKVGSAVCERSKFKYKDDALDTVDRCKR